MEALYEAGELTLMAALGQKRQSSIKNMSLSSDITILETFYALWILFSAKARGMGSEVQKDSPIFLAKSII